MRILALCPTYGRPRLLANALACFLAQRHADKYLVIIDDAQQIAEQSGPGWEVLSLPRRAPSLPHKYALGLSRASRLGEFGGVAIWDDDDVYLPDHLGNAAAVLEAGAAVAKPSQVWSTYTGRSVLESGAGRFWASTVVSVSRLTETDGFFPNPRADFDQNYLRTWGPAADVPPTYCFRWSSTGAPHAQGFIRSPGDTDWFDRMPLADPRPVAKLLPSLDVETRQLYAALAESSR